jgi:glycolate oxidase iron-sulfur subunit
MHLVDHARVWIEKTYDRPPHDRLVRQLLAFVLPYRNRFGAALWLARLGRRFGPFLERWGTAGERLQAMLRLAPRSLPPRGAERPGRSFAPEGKPRGRVALLTGCAQAVIAPEINAATVRLLNRLGVEVVLPRDEGCCGAIVHHLGREKQSLGLARANIEAWTREIEGRGLDAIVITASGCGTTVKDYGHMFRNDPAYAEKAARISGLALDVTEYLARLDLPPAERGKGLTLAYHSACSMQHGQRITTLPKLLLERAGFAVRDVPEGHICCGSAGTYNILQPEIATRLRNRKIRNIASLAPDAIAAGNIGCITQIASGTEIPIFHTVELLDWAYGGDELELAGDSHAGAGPALRTPGEAA